MFKKKFDENIVMGFKELWDKSAEKYDEYEKDYKKYKKTNKKLIELAQIKEEHKIVDLACGTGFTTIEILKVLEDTGKIYAVDFSKGMIKQAKRKIKNNNVEFIVSDASEIDNRIDDEIDRVVCNSAFWQFNDKNKVLECLKKILKKDGLFVFNLPEQVFDFKDGQRVPEIFKKRKRKKYTYEIIKDLLKRNEFYIKKDIILAYEEKMGSIAKFLEVPIFSNSRGLDNLSKKKRTEKIEKIKKKFEGKKRINKWIYFICKK